MSSLMRVALNSTFIARLLQEIQMYLLKLLLEKFIILYDNDQYSILNKLLKYCLKIMQSLKYLDS